MRGMGLGVWDKEVRVDGFVKLVQFLIPTGYAKDLLSLQMQEVGVVMVPHFPSTKLIPHAPHFPSALRGISCILLAKLILTPLPRRAEGKCGVWSFATMSSASHTPYP